MSEPMVIANTPKDLADYAGQFVVFFSEETKPAVLFSSFIAEDAYVTALKIKEKEGREPVVFRVQENIRNNISQVLAHQF